MPFISHQRRHVAGAQSLISQSGLVRPAPSAWAGGPEAPSTIEHRLLSSTGLDQDHPRQ